MTGDLGKKFEDRILATFELDTLGLPYPVVLKEAVVERIDLKTNEVIGHAIPDMDSLIAAVAMARCLHPMQLSGDELRFMRKVIGMKSKSLAESVGMSPSTYSRVENEKEHMGGYVEQLIRELICEELKDKAPAIDYTPRDIIRLRITNQQMPITMIFSRVVFKDGVTRERLNAWDTLKLAA